MIKVFAVPTAYRTLESIVGSDKSELLEDLFKNVSKWGSLESAQIRHLAEDDEDPDFITDMTERANEIFDELRAQYQVWGGEAHFYGTSIIVTEVPEDLMIINKVAGDLIGRKFTIDLGIHITMTVALSMYEKDYGVKGAIKKRTAYIEMVLATIRDKVTKMSKEVQEQIWEWSADIDAITDIISNPKYKYRIIPEEDYSNAKFEYWRVE